MQVILSANQATVLFSHTKSATSQSAVLFSHNKSSPTISHCQANTANDGVQTTHRSVVILIPAQNIRCDLRSILLQFHENFMGNFANVAEYL
jgi:hypothetical protein